MEMVLDCDRLTLEGDDPVGDWLVGQAISKFDYPAVLDFLSKKFKLSN